MSADIEGVLAEVLREHRMNDLRGDYEIKPFFKWLSCAGCDWTQNIAGMSGWHSWVAAHSAHVAAEQAKALAGWAQQDEVVERATNAAVYLNAYAARKVLTAIFGSPS